MTTPTNDRISEWQAAIAAAAMLNGAVSVSCLPSNPAHPLIADIGLKGGGNIKLEGDPGRADVYMLPCQPKASIIEVITITGAIIAAHSEWLAAR